MFASLRLSSCFCFRTLCDSGANIDLPNAKGETPLLTAVKRGDEGIARHLLSCGANPAVKSSKVSGKLPLFIIIVYKKRRNKLF